MGGQKVTDTAMQVKPRKLSMQIVRRARRWWSVALPRKSPPRTAQSHWTSITPKSVGVRKWTIKQRNKFGA